MRKYILCLTLLIFLSRQGNSQTFNFPCDKDNVDKSSFSPHQKLNLHDSVYAIDTNKVDFIFRYHWGDYNQLVLYHYKKHDTWKAFNYKFCDEYGKKYTNYRLIVATAEIKKNIDYKQLWDSLKAHDVFILPNTNLHVRPPTEKEKNDRLLLTAGMGAVSFELVTKNCYHKYVYGYDDITGGGYRRADEIQAGKLMEFLEDIKDPKSTKFLKK